MNSNHVPQFLSLQAVPSALSIDTYASYMRMCNVAVSHPISRMALPGYLDNRFSHHWNALESLQADIHTCLLKIVMDCQGSMLVQGICDS